MSHGKRWLAATGALALTVGAVGGAAAQSPAAGEPIKLGMAIHVLGNPFIQQIVDGANAAAQELNVDLQVVGPEGGSPDEQLALIQGLAQSGVQGIVTSVPGATLADPLNEIIDSGIPVVQFNLLDKGVKAPYVGERSVESGRILGAKVIEKLGGDSATGKVIVGNCLPGYPVLENRQAGVLEALAAAPGLTMVGPFDVKTSATENYAAWEAAYTANPDAVALIGLCAPDIASLGQLQAANPDTLFVSGGYDLTAENLAAIKSGNAYVSLGQTPFMQGYLPVKILVDSINAGTQADLQAGGFIDSGTEIVTIDSVQEPFELPAMTFEDLEVIAGDPAAARAYYQPLVDGRIANWKEFVEPIENEGL
ncbi:MAG: substrate-binding domain-containing protein [Chloroflexi bacterium]|nr:substrate-binding domain-containing protein [Chloroflexota bacterium]